MENEPIRVLQIGAGPFINRGVEKFLMNMYENVDRKEVQFDFLTPCDCQNEGMRTQIRELGGQLYEFKIKPFRLFQQALYFIKLISFLKSHKYSIIHINTGNIIVLTMCSFAGKLLSIPQIIVHSHNTGICTLKYKVLRLICTPLLQFCPTHYFACSKLAGKFIFPKSIQDQVIVIPNAIDVARFIYCENTRKEIRRKLNITNKFVIGHVGAFVSQKNHYFLIKIFNEVYKRNSNAILLLIGDGEMQEEIKNEVCDLGLSSVVYFYGTTPNTSELYQGMDCFVFPSQFEGLGIVAIEAQTAGLKTLCADTVQREAKITDLFEYMSLSETPEKWAEKILSYNNGYERRNMSKEIRKAGYDITEISKQLENLYLEMSNPNTRETIF